MLIAGRYERQALLREDAGMATWLGLDRQSDRPVTIRSVGPDSGLRLRLRHDIDRLQRTGVVSLLHLHEESLIAEFQPGPTLREHLSQGPRDWREVARAAAGLLATLARAHAAGVLHRGLKPSNLVVSGENWIAVDWGLCRATLPQTTTRELPLETLQYLAPELTGSILRDIDARADLYAIGAIVHECLAGRAPFVAETPSELLFLHLTQTPPPLDPSLPLALRQWTSRLLDKEPSARYPSAEGARQALERILAGEPVMRAASAPPITGRQRERAALRESRQTILVGPPGSGKSTLLDELCREAAARGTWVIRSQVVSRSESVPLQLLEGVFHEVGQALNAELAARLRPYLGILARIAPELEPWSTAEDAEEYPENLGTNRVMRALDHLVRQLARPDRPILLALDDVQWADGLSQTFLEQFLRAGVPAHTSLVLSTRPPSRLASGEPTRTVELGPLDPADAEALLQHVGAHLSAEHRARVVAYAEGNPFLLLEGARGLDAAGAELTLSTHGADLLAHRLETLSPGTLRALRAGAVLGRRFRLATVVRMLGPEAHAGLEDAWISRVLWQGPSGLDYSFAHDRFREQLLEQLEGEELRTLHCLAAGALDPDNPGALATHLAAAGELVPAYPHALRAAEEARERYEFWQAAGYYRIALLTEPDSWKLHERLADVLSWSGLLEEAENSYRRALKGNTDWSSRGRVYYQLARFAHHRASYAEALALVEATLLELRRRPWEQVGGPMLDTLVLSGEIALRWGWSLPKLSRMLGRLAVLLVRRSRGPESLFPLASVCSLLGHYGATNGLARKWLYPSVMRRVERENHTPFEMARLLSRLHTAHVNCRPLAEYQAAFEQAFEQFLRSGDLWETSMAFWGVSLGSLPAGQLIAARQRAAELYRLNTAADYTWGRLFACAIWAEASGGELPEPVFKWLEGVPPQGGFAEYQRWQALAHAWARRGRALQAALVVSQKTPPYPSVLMGLLTNLRAGAWRLAAQQCRIPWERAAMEKKAWRLARSLRRSPFPITQAPAYRELALMHAGRGERRLAERWFRRSLEVAESIEMHYEAAATSYAWERYRESLGEPAQPEVPLGRLVELGATWYLPPAAPQLALLDRLEQSLEWGHRIASSLGEGVIFGLLRQAARPLLRCEATAIYRHPGEERLAGPPVAVSEAGIRVPVVVEGETVAFLRAAVEGEEENRVARFLVSLAEAALENTASQKRFEAFFREAPVALALTSADGIIEEANPALSRMLGQTELQGCSFQQFCPELPGATDREVRLRTSGGAVIWAYVTESRMGASRLLSLADVTHQRLAELVQMQENERRLLSADIHDRLAQSCVGLSLMWQRVGAQSERVEVSRELCARLQAEAEELIANWRGTREPQALLTWLQSELERATSSGLQVTAFLPEPAGVPSLPLSFACRILGEGIANVLKHAGASRLEARLTWEANRLTGMVRDNGVGFRVEEASRYRSGLAGMRLRAELLGGVLALRSAPGQGTELTLELPTFGEARTEPAP